MNKTLKCVLEVAWYVIAFLLIQLFITSIVAVVSLAISGVDMNSLSSKLQNGNLGMTPIATVISTVLSSAVTIAIFAWRKWSPFSRTYMSTRPWGVLAWVAVLALGLIIPLELLQEQFNFDMPEEIKQTLSTIMGQPLGYFAIGIIAPFAEEMVFRGAVLRKLLGTMSRKWHWVAIAISAALFGLVHGNLPQMTNAFILGLLLGWLYYRTDSIVPGVVLHWVNNTIVYVFYNIRPDLSEEKLIDLFHGDQKYVILCLVFSLCIAIPALFQLTIRLGRKE